MSIALEDICNNTIVRDAWTTDSSLLAAAVADADNLYIPADLEIEVTQALPRTGGIIIDGNGSKIITNGDFDLTGTIDITVPLKVDGDAVSAVTISNTSNIPTEYAASHTYVTRASVADASLYARGDVVKLYSEEQIPQSGTTNDEYIGEFAVVVYPDEVGNHVYLDRVLLHSEVYSTRVRLSALSNDKVSISNLIIEKSASQASTANTKGIIIRNAVAPTVRDITFVDCDDDGITYMGCFGARTDNIEGLGLKTSSANSATGYLVFDVSSSHGVHTGLNGNALRNVYNSDTKTPATPATDPQMYFGESVANTVSDSTGISFGLHAGARDAVFSNCRIPEGTYRTPDTSITRGFTNRGVNNTFNNCVCKGAALTAYTEAGATVGFSLNLVNCDLDAVPVVDDDETLRTPTCSFTGISGALGTVNINGGRIRGIYSSAITFDYVAVKMYNPLIEYGRNAVSASSSNFFVINNDCDIKLFDPVFDSSEHLGTATLRLFDMNQSTSSIEIYGATWIGADGGSASSVELGTLSSLDGTALIHELWADTELANDLVYVGSGATTSVRYTVSREELLTDGVLPKSSADGKTLEDSCITETASGDDAGVNIAGQVSVGNPGAGNELVAGEGDSYPVIGAWHCTIANTTDQVVTGATDVSEILQSDSSSTTGLFGGVTAGNYVLVYSNLATFGGTKVKIDTAGTIEPNNITGEYLSATNTWTTAPFMAADSDSLEQYGNVLASRDDSSEQWRFGFNPLSLPVSWEELTMTVNGTDYTGYFARFKIDTDITLDPVIQQVKLHTNRMEVNANGRTEYFGKSRYAHTIDIKKYTNADKNPRNENVKIAPGVTCVCSDNQFTDGANDGIILKGILPEGIDTSIPVLLHVEWYAENNNTGDVELELETVVVTDGFVFDGNAAKGSTVPVITSVDNDEELRQVSTFLVDVSDALPNMGFIGSLFRDATSGNSDDDYSGNVILTKVVVTGYFWKP